MNGLLSYNESLALVIHSVKLNDLYTALKICKSSESLSPPDQRLNFIYAAILNQLGLFEDAINIYKLVLESDVDNELAIFQLGVAYIFSERIDEAKLTWKDNAYFYNAIKGFLHLVDKNPTEAKIYFNLFIKENHKYPELNPDLFALCNSVKETVNLDEGDDVVDNDSVYRDSKVDALLSVYKKNI